MLPSLDYYFHAKNLKDRLIPSCSTDDQTILQTDCTRGTTGYIQLVASDVNFLWWLSPCKRSKRSNDSFPSKILMVKDYCNLIAWKDFRLYQIFSRHAVVAVIKNAVMSILKWVRQYISQAVHTDFADSMQ